MEIGGSQAAAGYLKSSGLYSWTANGVCCFGWSSGYLKRLVCGSGGLAACLSNKDSVIIKTTSAEMMEYEGISSQSVAAVFLVKTRICGVNPARGQ